MKSQRHLAIMDIITKKRIINQKELCRALRDRGFDVTQATVSRDIKELHLVKVPDREGYRYALPNTSAGIRGSYERMKHIFRDSIVKIDYTETLIIIKTLPGAAQSVASIIDLAEIPNILGTVAGDDTIFVAVKPKKAVVNVFREFKDLLYS